MKGAKERLSKTAASGMVALVFLVLGFQLAIFVIKVVERPLAAGDARSEPGMTQRSASDMTQSPAMEASEAAGGISDSGHFSGRGTKYRSSGAGGAGTAKTKLGGYGRPSSKPAKTCESFPFDPNTVTIDDLQRLGLSPRQAESIDNYRSKGGRFRSKADFQKMYVVSDTLFARLEPYIEIPKLELNAADSTALVSLRGIGPYYARKILDYRERLGGFVDVAQLREIEGIDGERYGGLSGEVCADPTRIRPPDLWHASDSALARHPYIGPRGARSLLRYRQISDSSRWTLSDLARERVLPLENIEKLKKYIENQ